MLFVAVLGVAIGTRYAREAYTVGLVIMGLVIGAIPGHPTIRLTPELVIVAQGLAIARALLRLRLSQEQAPIRS